MNVLDRRRDFSSLRAPARRILAAVFALISAGAMWSCDSDDAPPDVVRLTPTGTPMTMETDTSGGEPIVFSQQELSSEYGSLGGLVAEAASANIWRQFRGQQQVKLTVSGRTLIVKAIGDNPVLIMPRFAAGQRFLIEAVIESSSDTFAQLFYLTPGQSTYREDQSQKVELKTGRNVVYLKIDDPNVVDPLRFDPAATPGTYTLERMTARPLGPPPTR